MLFFHGLPLVSQLQYFGQLVVLGAVGGFSGWLWRSTSSTPLLFSSVSVAGHSAIVVAAAATIAVVLTTIHDFREAFVGALGIRCIESPTAGTSMRAVALSAAVALGTHVHVPAGGTTR